MTANPTGSGGYILTCEGGVWVATISGATPTANEHLATKAYVDAAAGGGGGIGGMQFIETTGNFTVPAGVTTIKATIIGGGAGGTLAQRGGGGGGWRMGVFTVTAGQTILCTVGAAGNGGDAYSVQNGGNTTFNGMIANGGYEEQVGGGSSGPVGTGGGSGGRGGAIAPFSGGGGGSIYGALSAKEVSVEYHYETYGSGGTNGWQGVAGVCVIEW